MNFLKETDYKKRFEFYIKKGVKFAEVETKKKRYLQKDKSKYYLKTSEEEKPLPLASLGLMMKAKKNIIKNFNLGKHDKFNFPNNTNIDVYQCINKLYQQRYDNKTQKTVLEFRKWEGEVQAVDLSAAYITEARNMGLLDESIYKLFFEEERRKFKRIQKSKIKDYCGHNGEVYKHSKKIRLIALGALAQHKTIINYDKGKHTHTDIKYNEELANIFFTVSLNIGKLMIEVLQKFEGLFSYVDCIFIPEEKAEAAREFLKGRGFDTNIKKGYLIQSGKNFSFFKSKGGGETKYTISASKRPFILNKIIDRSFVSEISKEYKEILNICDQQEQEIVRRAMSKLLVEKFKLESVKDLNLRFLNRELKKNHLVLSDIIQIKMTIEETHKDLFFAEILDFIILEKIIQSEDIEKINTAIQKTVIPEIEEIQEADPQKAELLTGKLIEREFKIDFN